MLLTSRNRGIRVTDRLYLILIQTIYIQGPQRDEVVAGKSKVRNSAIYLLLSRVIDAIPQIFRAFLNTSPLAGIKLSSVVVMQEWGTRSQSG